MSQGLQIIKADQITATNEVGGGNPGHAIHFGKLH